jgi:NADH-quinone oxidoreductase subunit L
MDFQNHPGLIYVVVTLLPLASFVLLLLAAAWRSYLRSYRRSVAGESLYQLLGGDSPGKGGAYVATGAIGLSCVLSVIGLFLFVLHHPDEEVRARDVERQIQTAEQRAEAAGKEEREQLEKDIALQEQKLHEIESIWAGDLPWIQLRLPTLHDPSRGTVLRLGYRIDALAAIMFFMVTFIATLIHLFSIGYMGEELQPTVEDHQVHDDHGHFHRRGRFPRFFLFMSLFCFSMLNLILADNLFQVFVSWELVGVCSYLLIGFYYERRSAAEAANKAFITNRVGDAGFIIGLMIVWTFLGTFNFEEIFRQVRVPLTDSQGHGMHLAAQIERGSFQAEPSPGSHTLAINEKGSQVVLWPRKLEAFLAANHQPGREKVVHDSPAANQFGTMPYWLLVVAGLGIFLGCVGKSAQFPLHVWLPDAMEGPTPVSALIHAATMVAAGVYLVGRCYPLFTGEVLLTIAYTGGITLFVAATIAIVMTDIKKVLAYSTVSQLGYMMLALGVGGWVAGLFHLLTHAFFKALLFLGSGSVIYGCHHEQDMSKMGGLYPKMKTTALTMLAGVLSIGGIPLFSGWYSKDAILAQAFGFMRVHPEHALLFVLPLVTAGITAFYMFRMWFLTFAGTPRDDHVYERAHESPRVMTVPLVILAVCSVAIAWGWPIWDAKKSGLEAQLHHAQYPSVKADFGVLSTEIAGEEWTGGAVKPEDQNARQYAEDWHELAGTLALLMVGLGIVFAGLLYYRPILDPAEAAAQFPGLHRFLANKWRFDELYSVFLVRPGLVVAGWCRAFDTYVIDGFVDFLGRLAVLVSKWDGMFDHSVVDGLVNLVGQVCYGIGLELRRVQTGYLRSYVLFLALAAVGVFILLAYFMAMAMAG